MNDHLEGWVPLYLKAFRGEVEWAYMGSERFTEPFCQDTLHRLASKPFNQIFGKKSGLDLLLERAQRHPGLPLNGLIFHMSRCGSTLASQYLAAFPDSVVLSEPEPVDAVLQCSMPDGREELLCAMVSAMGQPRRKEDRSLYLKADCSHFLQIERYLAAFPGVPWIFMYRDPVEVLVSHSRNPGLFQLPPAMQGTPPPEEAENSDLAYAAWFLSLMLQHAGWALRNHPNGMLLNYSELPQGLESVTRHFGCGQLDEAKARAVAGLHSKRREVFEPDSEEKQKAADPEIIELAARFLQGPYLRLEELRLGRI